MLMSLQVRVYLTYVGLRNEVLKFPRCGKPTTFTYIVQHSGISAHQLWNFVDTFEFDWTRCQGLKFNVFQLYKAYSFPWRGAA